MVGLLAIAVVQPASLRTPRAPSALMDLIPNGPLLVVQVKEFSSLLRDWNDSTEKTIWLESDNFQTFSRSRLYLRLESAYGEFAQAAGFAPDMPALAGVAGAESVLALYDIGKLEFLYLTRIPSSRAIESMLWRSRGKFEPRSAANLPYYVRTDPRSRRVVGFAATDDLLLLATREDLLAGALSLVAGRPGSSLKNEGWYDRAVRAAGQAGDLRLVMNFETIVRSPYFRSYWVQQNVSDLRQYGAAISDLHRSARDLKEERVLLRINQDASPISPPAALANLSRVATDETGLYRAWARPSVEFILNLLERKILAPRINSQMASRIAPSVSHAEGTVGSEGDLETRIDHPPPAGFGSAFDSEPLRRILSGVKMEALLQLQTSKKVAGGTLVGNRSLIALSCESDWNGAIVRQGLLEASQGLWTTSGLGANWTERGSTADRWYELDGLNQLMMAARGHLLFIADDREMLQSVLGRIKNPVPPPDVPEAVYVARFRHASEREDFKQAMHVMDHPWIQQTPVIESGGRTIREPLFFSENVASLSRTLERLESVDLVVRDRGPAVYQTVVYRLSK